MSQRLATAEWADPEIYAKEHPYEEGKFWLGRSPLNGQPLGYNDDRHICLVSGTRSGKGTTSIINNLCLWPGSVVVVDPKGENATVTAARRGKGSEHCEGMGQAVHVLDPFGAAQVDDTLRSRFNPLDTLDPNDPITIDEAGRVADAIVVMNPESKDPFWDQSARTLVKGLILHVLTAPQFEGKRNLVTIRQLIARGDHEGIATLKDMGETDLPSAQALLWEGVAQNNAFNGVVAGIGDSMVNMAINVAKQFESVLQVANRNTEFLDSPGMQACLETSDFKLSDLKTDPNGVSVYLSLPQRYMGEHFRWLRMMITLTVTEMEATKGQPTSGHRVLMCLDEFAGLKRMEVIENAVAQIAGYGVKLFFVLQSLEQLKATYKDNWETFLSNAGLKIFFGIDDHFTREYVSKFIGETELLRELATATNTVNQQTTHSTGSSSSSSWNQQQSTGVSFSDNWKSMPFFLRNTAGLFAAISGKRQAARSQSTNSAKSDGGSDGTQSTNATATGTANAEGKNESLHKRALITPDEIGIYLGRIDDDKDPVFPGMSLILVSGQKPSVICKANYFEDVEFQSKFAQHPDHLNTCLEEITVHLLPEGVLEDLNLIDSRFAYGMSIDVYIYLVGQAPKRVAAGDVVGTAQKRWGDDDIYFELASPCSGQLLQFNNGVCKLLSDGLIDEMIQAANQDAVRRFIVRELEKLSEYNTAQRSESWWQTLMGFVALFGGIGVSFLIQMAFNKSGTHLFLKWAGILFMGGLATLFLVGGIWCLHDGISTLRKKPSEGVGFGQIELIARLNKILAAIS